MVYIQVMCTLVLWGQAIVLYFAEVRQADVGRIVEWGGDFEGHVEMHCSENYELRIANYIHVLTGCCAMSCQG